MFYIRACQTVSIPFTNNYILCQLDMRVSHTVVHDNDVQAVEELPLVFMDSLDMDVKHGGCVYFHPVLFLQVLGKFHFVVL